MITSYLTEQTIENIAMATYYANQAYRLSIGQKPGPPWSLVSINKKTGIKSGVVKSLSGLSPEQMHENWMVDKAKAGWTYGPIEDEREKIHPCMKPWHSLPKADQAKDELFIRVVRAMVDAIETGRQA